MEKSKILKEIEEYAKQENIPIMQKDGIEYLCKLIELNTFKNVLEIGTAIGYSAIKMALVHDDINITTIEKDIERYKLAVNNVNKLNLKKRITIINDDALNTNINDKFDLIFIDASKGNNINFFNKYKHNLTSYGIIVTDNLSFHGLVENDSLVQTKNQKGIVNKIKSFIDFLDNNKEFKTIYVSVGDRIAISKRNNE